MRFFRDSIHDNIYGERISENMYVDSNGQLICENVVLARTGYYDYLESELIEGGSPQKIVKVYRSPEEVFDPVSMRSMNFKPLTDDHPSENVTPDTVGSLQKGFMTNVRRGDNEFSECLMADLVVTDPYVIDEIRSGRKRDLSVGYTADIVDEGGQFVMKNIRGNHIALVDAGRAGNARIRDSKPVVDFVAKGSFNSLEELKKFYPSAIVEENGDKNVIVRLNGSTQLLYSYIPGSGRLFFVRKADPLRDSVEVLGDKHMMREGQRVRYFGEPCVVSRIEPDLVTGDFSVEFKAGDVVCGRLGYKDVVTNIEQGKIQLMDSVVFDSKTESFSLVPVADSTEDFSSCFSDKSSSGFMDAERIPSSFYRGTISFVSSPQEITADKIVRETLGAIKSVPTQYSVDVVKIVSTNKVGHGSGSAHIDLTITSVPKGFNGPVSTWNFTLNLDPTVAWSEKYKRESTAVRQVEESLRKFTNRTLYENSAPLRSRVSRDSAPYKNYADCFRSNYSACFVDKNTCAVKDADYSVGQKLWVEGLDGHGVIEKVTDKTVSFSVGRSMQTLSKDRFNFGVKNGSIKLLDSARKKVSDAASTLKPFAVSVGDRKFVTRAVNAADAVHKVTRKLADKSNAEFASEWASVLRRNGFVVEPRTASPWYRGPGIAWMHFPNQDAQRALSISRSYAEQNSLSYMKLGIYKSPVSDDELVLEVL